MKFTEGYWCIKKEITPLYAVEYADSRQNGNELTVYAPGKHISDRGDCLNVGMLTIRLTSPMEDVIRVSVSHFDGTVIRGPFARIYGTPPHTVIEETDEEIRYRSGRTTAVIDKRPNSWGIRFLDGDRELTNTGFRNMAYMTNRETGKCYMAEQLAIDVD